MLTDEEIEKLRRAGRIVAKAREYGAGLITAGASMIEVSEKVDAKIIELGAKPAFPSQISINSTAAHDCAAYHDERLLQKGVLCKLDVGVHIDGFIGDTAVTVDLGKNSALVKASIEALNAAIDVIKPGTELGAIGREIETAIKQAGFSPVRNLSGHGLGRYDVHTLPNVPNFDSKEKTQIKKGMVIAVEPFATDGMGLIAEKGHAEVFQLIAKKPVRAGFVREILKKIEEYEGMPFAKRWLASTHTIAQVNYALEQLVKLGAVKAYPPLVERADGMVSQAEHSIYVAEEPIVLTK